MEAVKVPNEQAPNASPVRVGYVLRMYPRFTQTFVVNEILELERQGVDVRILSLKKPTDGRFHESLARVKAKADYVPERWSESLTKVVSAHWNIARRRPAGYMRALLETARHRGAAWADFMQAPLLLRWVKKQSLKHVHIHFGTNEASVAYLANKMAGLSYSVTLHAFDIFRQNVDRELLARKINASRFVVTVSEYNRTFMIESVPRVNSDRIRVNHNGIDLTRFHGNGVARHAGTVVGVGRLIEKKGFMNLIRAVALLRDRQVDAHCTVVGDGPEREALKAEIKRLNLRDRVTLAGSLSQDQVRNLLTHTACFALPSVQAADGNVDALPTVLLEAMACGCPCVSTRISGIPEIIEDRRTGLLVEPANPNALADALAHILPNPSIAARWGRAGRRRAELLFDVRRNVAVIKRWFEQVTAALADPAGFGGDNAAQAIHETSTDVERAA